MHSRKLQLTTYKVSRCPFGNIGFLVVTRALLPQKGQGKRAITTSSVDLIEVRIKLAK
jgi:hypothetical protein